ncbi:energy transducer TonB [Uruburuella testudinis]|uniref:Protein TonB n=1 Tax=Uruburuella testudinis TaxID=1282863 RepID=A0ABY4DT87_9NEIS|nr:energy transducer TonB [Uruburuella testudinis]UOO82261.1 energy transducer TonB [Uruburuella testudinis]
MKNERILTPSVFAVMALLHIGLMSLLWRTGMPVQGVVEHIEFVDLGDLGGGDGKPEAAPEAVRPPPPPPKKVVPKPKSVEKPVIKPVVTKNEQADIRQKIEKPKPKEPEKIEPPKEPEQPKPQPRAQPAEQAPARTAAADNRGSGEARGNNAPGSNEGRGSGRGEGTGAGSGGSGSGMGGGTGAGSSAGNAVKATGQLPRPPYPPLSQENGEEGTVLLKIMVAPGGKVSNVTVAKSSGHNRLDRAARQAARNGRFQTKVWTEYSVPVVFKLE